MPPADRVLVIRILQQPLHGVRHNLSLERGWIRVLDHALFLFSRNDDFRSGGLHHRRHLRALVRLRLSGIHPRRGSLQRLPTITPLSSAPAPLFPPVSSFTAAHPTNPLPTPSPLPFSYYSSVSTSWSRNSNFCFQIRLLWCVSSSGFLSSTRVWSLFDANRSTLTAP